jgi:4-alpha-glucanotransferase
MFETGDNNVPYTRRRDRLRYNEKQHGKIQGQSSMKTKFARTDAWGIIDGYEDTLRRWHRVGRHTRMALRNVMGGSAGTHVPPADSRVLVLREGETRPLPQPAELTLEDGTVMRCERKLPSDLPIGYHQLRSLDEAVKTRLIIAPDGCQPPDELPEWGWALQLYALRSRRSWGLGDLADLRKFAGWSRRALNTGFILLNPTGAPLPVLPQEASPYYPSSRLYLHPLYLCVDEVPGAADVGAPLEELATAGRALNSARLIQRDAIFRLKMRALEMIYAGFRGHRAFENFRARQGESLRQFAVFCALAEHHGGGWGKWPARLRHPASAAVGEFAARTERRVRFHEWLQWLLDEQLARAASELRLVFDVPIGVNPEGFDAWLWQDTLALGASVGSPPDRFNTQGQNWNLPPFIPHRLRAAGYEPFRRTLQAMLRHARGLRIDHVMGLFRLFWIPHGAHPRDGGYVRYPADELLAVLAIESRRAGAVIVGEDLGTVERCVRPKLRRQNVLSYRLLWFEKSPPEKCPSPALAAVTTHDLFTVAGLWSGKDLEIQERLGLHPDVGGTEAIRRRLRRRAGLSDEASPREAILGAHRLLARTPCRLRTATLEDALAVEERPNMPGTTRQWPNWSIALPGSLGQIQRDPFVRKLAKVMTRRGLRKQNSKSRARLERRVG